MIFQKAWNVAKDVDFRMPLPHEKPPSWIDADATLALPASLIPPAGKGVDLSEIDENFVPYVLNTDVGAFEPGETKWLGAPDPMDNMIQEVTRASIIRALMNSGIVTENELLTALDEYHNADARGERSRGQQLVRTIPDEKSPFRITKPSLKTNTPPKYGRKLWLTTELNKFPYGTEYTGDEN